MNLIEVKNLFKFYGRVEAVRGVSFEVHEGEIFGLLGPNGAGKTTILEILEGLNKPDSGVVKIFGKDLFTDVRAIREQIGIVFQQTGFFHGLTLEEILELFRNFFRTGPAVGDVIARFGLEKILRRRYADLSGGQRQRFVLATAVLNNPKVLFLDEPTAGLDPSVRQHFWDIITRLRSEGLTILLTTHYMDEAETICDRVGIIDQGKLIVCDRPVRLINSLGVVSKISFTSNKPVSVGVLEGLAGVIAARRDRHLYILETQEPERSLRELLEWESSNSGKIFNLQVQQATLEDVFLKLTGHSLRE